MRIWRGWRWGGAHGAVRMGRSTDPVGPAGALAPEEVSGGSPHGLDADGDVAQQMLAVARGINRLNENSPEGEGEGEGGGRDAEVSHGFL